MGPLSISLARACWSPAKCSNVTGGSHTALLSGAGHAVSGQSVSPGLTLTELTCAGVTGCMAAGYTALTLSMCPRLTRGPRVRLCPVVLMTETGTVEQLPLFMVNNNSCIRNPSGKSALVFGQNNISAPFSAPVCVRHLTVVVLPGCSITLLLPVLTGIPSLLD